MLQANATLIERLLAPLREAIAKTPKVPTGDVDRLLALGVPSVYDHRGIQRSDLHKRGRPHGTRPIAKVGAIGWHQDGTGELHEGHRLLLGVPAHAMVHRSGSISLLHDIPAYMYHGDAMNRFSIGVEIVCREPGVAARPSTLWLSKKERAEGKDADDVIQPLTEHQIWSALALGRWYADELERRGGKLTQMWCHRQAVGDKPSDPGERIYRLVVTPLIAELKCNDVSNLAIGGGKAIPREWGNPNGPRYA